jgi:hypothetical protein
MSEVQAVLFPKSKYNADQARRWLSKNGFKRMKRVDKSLNYLRYRITDPSQYSEYITKDAGDSGIKLVIGYP